jgi:hypothetical protein
LISALTAPTSAISACFSSPLRAADRLRGAVLLGAELLDARGERAAALVGRQQLVDDAREVATREAGPVRLGIVADRADVQHRYGTFTCAALSV